MKPTDMKRAKTDRLQTADGGLTLIELLVSFSLVAIMAAITIAVLTNSRSGIADVHIIADVQEARASLQYGFVNPVYTDLYFANGGAVVTNAPGALSSNGAGHAALVSVQVDITLHESAIAYRIDTNTISGGPFTPNAVAYAIYGRLVSDPSKYFCMDSAGKTNPATSTSLYSLCG